MEKVNTKNKQNKAKSFFLKIIKLAERIIIGKRAEEKEKLIAKERTYVSNNPVSNEEQYAQYIYAIDQKIDEEDIKNIGIVAPYGAGKSSIVKTYFDIHPDKKKKSKTGISTLEAPIFKNMMIQNRRYFTEFFENGKKQGVFKDLNPKVMASFIDIYLLGVESYSFLREKTLFDTEQSKSAFPEIEEMIVSAVCKKQK